MVEIRASKRSVNICDVYAGHQHLHLRDEEQAGAGIAATEKELNSGVCISSITLAELEYGMKHSSNPIKNEQALLRFLVPLSILPFGAAAASKYGEIRTYLQHSGTPIGPLDMLIAAHARSEDMILVTNNVREFERVPDLEVENWVE